MDFRRAALLAGLFVAALLAVTVIDLVRTMGQANKQDKEFLDAAHQGNLTAIAMGRAALEKTNTLVIRQQAQQVIRDHGRLDADLQAVAKAVDVQLPTTPSSAQQDALSQLSAKSGRAFDEAWLAYQITAHQAMRSVAEAELKDGSNDEVTGLAVSAGPVIQTHLSMFEKTAPGGAVSGTPPVAGPTPTSRPTSSPRATTSPRSRAPGEDQVAKKESGGGIRDGTPSRVAAGTGGQAAAESQGNTRLGWGLLGLAAIFAACAVAVLRVRRT